MRRRPVTVTDMPSRRRTLARWWRRRGLAACRAVLCAGAGLSIVAIWTGTPVPRWILTSYLAALIVYVLEDRR